MKYIYFFIATVSGVLLLVAFFQNIGYNYQVRFLNGYPYLTTFMLYLIFLGIVFGVSITLFIKSILSNENDLDDGFDL